MTRFFKLTTEISQIVRKANLTAAQLKIWLYFTEIDHNFPDFFLRRDRILSLRLPIILNTLADCIHQTCQLRGI